MQTVLSRYTLQIKLEKYCTEQLKIENVCMIH